MATTSAEFLVEVVAGTPATFDETGFAALSYTPIGCVTSVGDYGQTQAQVDVDCLVGPKGKLKGQNDWGNLTLGYVYDVADAGQIIVRANSTSASTSDNCSVKLTDSEGTIDYLYGPFLGAAKSVGSVNTVINTPDATLAITNGVMDIPAP